MNGNVSSFPGGYRSRSPIRSSDSQLDQVSLAINISQRRSIHHEDRTTPIKPILEYSPIKIIDGSSFKIGSKIINPITKRKISVGKITYKNLLKKGIIIDNRFIKK